MSLAPVRVERDGDVAVIVIDNPPVNAGSAAVRKGLLDAVAQIAADPAVVAGVLIGAGGSFISGSDVSEFGKPLQPPELPAVIAAIEACAKPIVAALDGAALGGGYELALGCDARIATADAMIGLPEVTLGMIPGAGGTQRLPRLVGIVRAIALICAGTRVAGTQAAAWGMVDAVAGGDLRADAVAMARALLGKQPVSARAVPPEGAEAVDAAVQSALRAERGRPAVIAAIEAVRDAGRLPFKMALAAERAVFTQLRLSGEAAALRHLFFAERRAGRWPGTAAARELSQAGVIGAGTMGAGIAAALLQAGLAVTLVDLADAALGRGVAAIDGIIARWHTAGRLTETQARELRGRLVTATLVDALAHCDVVIEAVVEDAGVKASLFATLDSVVSAETLIASNTSYLDLDALAAGTRDPGRVLGLHFFNPAQTMRLLEVVRGAATRDEAVATGLALSRRMGKQAVIARVGPGFIGNRIYAAYRRQCEFMIEDGAWPEQVDAALESFGFAMGPFATGDLSGLDIAWAMRRAGAASRDPAQRYVAIPDRLCEAGRLGRKTGAGWYTYPAGARRGVADPAVRDIILAESAARGIARRAFEDAEIVARVLVTMLNEAALLLSEGVAERASDIDVAFVHGYGFPRHQGGPLFWASRQEDAFLHRTRDAIGAATGAGFRVGDIDAVLTALRTGMNR